MIAASDEAAAYVPPSRPMGTASPEFLPHVHMLRALAIVLVVGAHCWPDFAWTPLQKNWVLLLFDNVTVVFMSISGLLFQHLSGRFVYARYLRHRFATVLLPYAIISIPAIFAVVYLQHRSGVAPWIYTLPHWQQFGLFLLTGKHMAPMWFMPMIALFILAAPVFVMIDRRNWYPLLLPASIVLATFLGRDSIDGLANVFGKALFMLPAYLAGMAFSRHRVACEAWCARHMHWLVLALAAVSLTIFAGWMPLMDFTLIQKLVLAAMMLVGLKRVPPDGHLARAGGRLARVSFAIYFVHGYVITIFRIGWERLMQVGSDAAPFAPSVPGLVFHIAIVALLSLTIVDIAQRILGRRSRMVIGA